jgi:hypothetical protein
MNKNKRVEPGDAIQLIASQGREILHEGNSRRMIARNPDGRVILDISVTQAVLGALLVVMLVPFGWLVLTGVAVYGISKKIKLDFVREVSEGDENATISASTKRKAERLSTPSSTTDVDGDTVIDDDEASAKAKPKKRSS